MYNWIDGYMLRALLGGDMSLSSPSCESVNEVPSEYIWAIDYDKPSNLPQTSWSDYMSVKLV